MKVKNLFSISFHLKYGPFLWVIFSLITLGTILIYWSFKIQTNQLEMIQQERSHAAAIKITSCMDDFKRELNFIARVKGIMNLPPSIFQNFIKGLTRHNNSIESSAIYDINGKLILDISSYKDKIGLNKFFFDSVSYVLNSKNSFTSMIETDTRTGLPFIILAVPLGNDSDKIDGVLCIKVNLKFLSSVILKINIGQTGYVYIIDNRNLIIAKAGTDPDFLQMENISEFPFINKIWSEKKKSSIYKGLNGKRVIGAWDTIRDTHWKVIVELPIIEGYAPIKKMVFVMFQFLIVISFIVIIWGFLLSRRIIKPLNDLTQASAKICAGDLSAYVKTRSRSELGILSGTFNEMATRLRELVLKLQFRIEFEKLRLNRKQCG